MVLQGPYGLLGIKLKFPVYKAKYLPPLYYHSSPRMLLKWPSLAGVSLTVSFSLAQCLSLLSQPDTDIGMANGK